MHRLDIDALRSLVAVAAFAGVGRAAAALHVSQPTVSGHLRRLERDLGVDLVERMGRGIAFTTAGDELARRAHRIVALHDEAVDALATDRDDDLVLAASDLATAPLLVAASTVLQEHFPDRPIRFRSHRSENIRGLVHSRAVDIALTFAQGTPGAVPVTSVPVGWYGATSSTALDALVVFTRPCTLRDVMLATKPAQSARIARECLDLLSVLDAVRSGVGITALPRQFAKVPGIRALQDLPEPAPMLLRMSAGPRMPGSVRAALREALVEASASAAAENRN